MRASKISSHLECAIDKSANMPDHNSTTRHWRWFIWWTWVSGASVCAVKLTRLTDAPPDAVADTHAADASTVAVHVRERVGVHGSVVVPGDVDEELV
jgi:hypothetical protein